MNSTTIINMKGERMIPTLIQRNSRALDSGWGAGREGAVGEQCWTYVFGALFFVGLTVVQTHIYSGWGAGKEGAVGEQCWAYVFGALFFVGLTVVQTHIYSDDYPSHLYSSDRSSSSSEQTLNSQGIATLFVMIAVLTIIILFCCFSAPGIRSLCKRYIFKSCRHRDPDSVSNAGRTDSSTGAPTVILLSNGQMLVVDRNIFGRLRIDNTGLDFMELSSAVMNAQQRQRYLDISTPSIDVFIDSDTSSKGISPTSLGYSPPNYGEIFNSKGFDLPPSYSEVSFMLKSEPNWGLPLRYNTNEDKNTISIRETALNNNLEHCSDNAVNNNLTRDFFNIVEIGYNSEEQIVPVHRDENHHDNFAMMRVINSIEDLENNNDNGNVSENDNVNGNEIL